MKKTLVALAVLGSFAGVASAATSVTLYGNVDAAYEKWHGSGGMATAPNDVSTKIKQGGTDTGQSTYGLKGQEDLGNGVAAIFTLEGRFNGDDGANDTKRLFERESTVGLKGAFGEVKFGRSKSQMELTLGSIVPGNHVADIDLYSVALSRHSNGLFYSYDNAGLSFGADVTTKGGANGNVADLSVAPASAQVATEGAANSKIGWGARLGWTGNVGGATLLARGAFQNDGAVATTANGGKQGYEAGALVAVAFDPVTIGAAYSRGRGNAAGFATAKGLLGTTATVSDTGWADKANTLSAVIAGKLTSADSVYVKYQKRDAKSFSGATLWNESAYAGGYSHALSKRTSLYLDAVYVKPKEVQVSGVTTSTNDHVWGGSVGMNHSF